MADRNFLKISLIIIALIGALFFWLFLEKTKKPFENGGVPPVNPAEHEFEECSIMTEEKIVRGSSLSGLIEDGQTITVFSGYYTCNEIERGDIVLYSYAGNEAPLIKVVKGIPGDKFNLREAEGGWHILINGETVKNSEDIPYLISGKRYQMLSLYEKEYLNGIADNAYLILGNIPSGATDSTRFGFVSAKDILGKVKY